MDWASDFLTEASMWLANCMPVNLCWLSANYIFWMTWKFIESSSRALTLGALSFKFLYAIDSTARLLTESEFCVTLCISFRLGLRALFSFFFKNFIKLIKLMVPKIFIAPSGEVRMGFWFVKAYYVMKCSEVSHLYIPFLWWWPCPLLQVRLM